ncbi:MAG: hypothetical protein ACRD10_07645, partial [Terriglobia bacterium]
MLENKLTRRSPPQGIRIDWDVFSEAALFILAWAVVAGLLWVIYTEVSRSGATSIACLIALGIFLAERREGTRWRLLLDRYYFGERRGITDKEWE